MSLRHCTPFPLINGIKHTRILIRATPAVKEATASIVEITASPTAFKPTPPRRPSEAERKEFLESDKQIQSVERHRVCCRKCQNWIDLSETNSYATGNWVKHKARCSDAMYVILISIFCPRAHDHHVLRPSNRVAAAKRKLIVVNDPQAKSYDARKIECGFCGVAVTLEGEGDFNLTRWDEHKSSCTKFVFFIFLICGLKLTGREIDLSLSPRVIASAQSPFLVGSRDPPILQHQLRILWFRRLARRARPKV